MGVIYKATNVKDWYGKRYNIEIIDRDFEGDPIEIEIGPQGWIIEYQGGTDDPHTRIITSSATLEIQIQNEEQEALIALIASVPENRLFLKIIYIIGDLSIPQFIGPITADRITWENQYYPFTFQIAAIDGLSKLKDVDYRPLILAGHLLHNRFSMLERIFQIFSLLDMDDLYGSETAIVTITDWYESNMANTTDDPLSMVDVAWWGFIKEESLNSYKVGNAFKALEDIATLFNARVYYAFGRFYFENVNQKAKDTNDSWSYQIDGTFIAKIPITNDQQLVDNVTLAVQRGSNYSLIPPVRDILLTFFFKTDINYLHDQLDSFNYLGTGEQDLGTFQVDPDQELKFLIRGRLRWDNETYFDFDPLAFTTWKMRFRITLKVGDKWLKRERLDDQYYNTGFGSTTWEDSESFYYLDSEIFYYDTLFSFMGGYIDINILTPEAISSGDIIFNIDLYKVFRPDDILVTEQEAFQTSFLVKWYFDFPQLNLTTADGKPYQTTNQILKYQGPIENSRRKEMFINFGDGPNTSNVRRIMVYDGAEWVESGRSWSPKGSSIGLSIQKLLLLEVASVLVKPIKLLNATLIHRSLGLTPNRAINYQSTRLIFLSGQASSTQSDFNGTWFSLNPEMIE